MKSGIFVLIILVNHSLLLFSQANPVNIDLRDKGLKLDSKFYVAEESNKAPTVILLHGFPGNQSSPLGLAERLNSAGLNILVFNYQGSYLSDGNFSFDNSIDNVSAALSFLLNSENQIKYKIDTSKIVVCGYSFGGTIAIESAMYNDKVRYLISIANDDHSISIKKAAADPEFREAYQKFVGGSFGPSGPFRGDLKALMEYNIQNVDRYDLVKNAEKLKSKKILFLVGWQDNTSLIENNILPLYRKLMQVNKLNTSIKGFESDHRFNNVIDELSQTIISWIKNN
ncbi:MAG: alpha/beta hydrolase [Methanococcaceae archaeon]